ncbi:MAG: ATP-binding cassette domain-containing protein [Oscillospiraceae bacterium]|nr:ATP-binding cassette domain-containing protein [Candidatus Limimonas egerieequi]
MADFEIKNLSFSYATNPEKRVLDNINLTIEHGEYITVCGKSGSGKSTLLRHLKTVLAPAGERVGIIKFNGKELSDISTYEQASFIGFVMQNPDDQIVTDKVWHELAFGLENLGCDKSTIRLRVAEMASYFGIQNWFDKDTSDLSGGQKQLLNLASIMAMQPSVLILDEPTSQLDPIAAADFLNTVRKINLELGTTIIITEHRLEDILYASDRVVLMQEGKILACDEPHKIGEYLKSTDNEMFAAMPTPVQVYHGIDSAVTSSQACPLTVREGAEFLTSIIGYTDKLIPSLEKAEDIYDEKAAKKDAVISLSDVWFRYERQGRDILKGVDLNVPKGKLFAIVGGNGTGKSTTLKAICNVVKPYRGKVRVNGHCSMLPQDPASLFVKETVKDELLEMTHDNERIESVAKTCDIEHLFASHPFDISGGEQQRVALAKVLLCEPEIILLDEPTKGLDNFFKIKFAGILKELTSLGVTIVMVSHDVEFCARYADICSMFFDGNIVTTNAPCKFFSENSFYTTAANRMSRHLFLNAINVEDVIELCAKNLS